VLIHTFVTLVLGEGECLAVCPGCFSPWERSPRTHWVGSFVDPRASLDAVEKGKHLSPLPEIEPQFIGHAACSVIAKTTELFQHCAYGG
jgi:hypothetical protein